MDEIQIKNIIENDKFASKEFAGVYSRTHIKHSNKCPSFYIINLDDYGSKGFHWIATYITKNKIYIFDSFGGNFLNDGKFRSFIKYCRKYNQDIVSSPYIIQHMLSSTCGMYCILLGMMFARKYSFSEFLNMFKNNNQRLNDYAIADFFKKHYNVNLK